MTLASTRTIEVNVTIQDIEESKASRAAKSWDFSVHQDCPIARAIFRLGAHSVFVDLRRTYINGQEFFNPYDAQDFIEAFDTEIPVGPMKFSFNPK